MAKRKYPEPSNVRSSADDRSSVLAPPPADEAVVAPQLTGDTTAANVDRERIASRAYELYRARGGADGHDMDDWLEAERELAGGTSRSTRSETSPRPGASDHSKEPSDY